MVLSATSLFDRGWRWGISCRFIFNFAAFWGEMGLVAHKRVLWERRYETRMRNLLPGQNLGRMLQS